MEEEEKHINLHATPEMMAGVYANFANVSHSDYEFSITFMRLDHESEDDQEVSGVVVSRVNMSARFMKELFEAMKDNLQQVAGRGEHPQPAGVARPGVAPRQDRAALGPGVPRWASGPGRVVQGG